MIWYKIILDCLSRVFLHIILYTILCLLLVGRSVRKFCKELFMALLQVCTGGGCEGLVGLCMTSLVDA